MFVCFFVFVARMFSHNLISRQDRQWLRHFDDVINNREENIPEAGRYNGGQKVLFFALILLVLGLLVTGVVMWRPYFAAFFPIWSMRLASLLPALFVFLIDRKRTRLNSSHSCASRK